MATEHQIAARASGTSMVQIIAQVDRIIRAIHSTVPQELWEEIMHKIDGPVPADIRTDDIEDCEDADEYGPMVAVGTLVGVHADFENQSETRSAVCHRQRGHQV